MVTTRRASPTSGPTAGDSGYGTFELVGGTWTYTLDQGAVQDLDVPQSVIDRMTYEATDGTVRQVTVTIIGTDDAPRFTSSTSVSVTENRTDVLKTTSTDADGDIPTYSIAGGTDQERFALDSKSGELTFQIAPDFESPADAGANNVYDVIVRVEDANGGSAAQAIAVTVTDTNEPPTITSPPTVDTPENQLTVLTVTGTDADANDTLDYAIVDGDDAALFTIDATTGELRFQNAPDFELPADTDGNGVYDVAVRAMDAGGLHAVRAFAITVSDVNEAPVISSADDVEVTENQTVVLTITGTDADGDAPRWSISGGSDAALFALDGESGELSFLSAPDFERPADADGDNVHEVVVQASDGKGGIAERTITVTVGDVDETPRAVADALAAREDTPRQIAPSELLGNDIDPERGALRLAAFGQPAHGTLTQGADGTLEYRPDANYNGTDGFEYEIADAAGNRSSAQVSLDVAEVNDPPTLVDPGADRPGRRPGIIDAPSAAAGPIVVSENAIDVGLVEAADIDGVSVSFALAGADASLFEIDPSSGALRPLEPLDFEAPRDADGDNRYELELVLRDEFGEEARVPLVVTAEDVNESPVLIDSVFTLEEGFVGTLGQLSAFDPDANERLVFELVPDGNGVARGSLVLLSDGRLHADGLSAGEHVFDVRVVDAGGLVSIGRVTVVVKPFADSAPALGAAEPTVEEPTPSPASVPARPGEPSVPTASPPVPEPTPRAADTVAIVERASLRPQLATLGSLDVERAPASADAAFAPVSLDEAPSDTELTVLVPLPDPVAPSALPSPVRLLELLDELRSAIEEFDARELGGERTLTVVTTVGGITLAVGFAHWLLGSRLLLAAALSSVSLWQPIDPVPVLSGNSRGGKDDDEENGEGEADDRDDAPGANRPGAEGGTDRGRSGGYRQSG